MGNTITYKNSDFISQSRRYQLTLNSQNNFFEYISGLILNSGEIEIYYLKNLKKVRLHISFTII
jgi:hypothetical protein